MDLQAVFTNDERYKDIKAELTKMEKEGRSVKMCHVAQALEEKGIKKGLEQGRALGIIETSLEGGMSESDILDKLQEKLEISLKVAKDYLRKYKKHI